MLAATPTEIAAELHGALRGEPFYPLIEANDVVPALVECGWCALVAGRLNPQNRRVVLLAKRNLQARLAVDAAAPWLYRRRDLHSGDIVSDAGISSDVARSEVS